MLSPIVLFYLPLIYLAIYLIQSSFGKEKLTKTAHFLYVAFIIVMILSIAFFPEDLSIDKPRYVNMYNNSLWGGYFEYKDPGWMLYNIVCGRLFGNSIDLFFILTATIYVGGIYVFGRKFISKEYAGYFIVMVAGCLGFSNYGTNVIRAGMALSLLLIAVSLKCKFVFKILIAIVAISIQKSVVIPIVGFICASYINKTYLFALLWAFCLFLSANNIDIGPLFESVGFVDERIEQYANSINGVEGIYEKGFRWDFLIYSIVPMIIAFYYIEKIKVIDNIYITLVKTYLFANSIWLLAIRMAFSDRLAYLSWFLIPFITIYPVIKYRQKFSSPQGYLFLIMSVFMGVRVVLSLRGSM